MDEDFKRRPVSDIIGKFEKPQFSTEAKKQRSQKVRPKPPFVQPGLRNVISSQTIQQKQDSVSAVDHSYTSSPVELRLSKNVKADRTQGLDSTNATSFPANRSVRSVLNDQVDLLLIGKTGNGKSALGNSIIDYKAFVSEPSATSVTKEVSDEANEVNGRTIKVVDSPGVGDTDWANDETTKFVVDALTQAIAINPEGYHAFLFVVRFGGRFTKEDQGTVDFLKKVFGQSFVRKFCILVLTYGDQFEAHVKVSFQDWIQSQKGVLSDLVKECNNRVILFDNQTTDRHKKQRQVSELIEIVDSLKQENSRYSNDQFDLASDERESLELTSKAPLIIDKAMTKADVIFKQFKRIQETFLVNYDPSPLEQLLDKIETLYDSVRQKDNKTGVLGDLLRHLESLKSLICSEIQLCRRLPEVEKHISKKYDNQLEESTKKLKDAKLNFDRLSQERKKSELHNIQTLKEDNRRLKKENEELEMNQSDHFLQFQLITNKIPEINEQYTQIKEKHRKNVLSSMFHKIAKTFSKKTKNIDLPKEQDDLEIDVSQFMY
ncbi:GTPase IMAP family member [Biomphalaria pfeifferi]|uniref:GTPase IMAP family member n=1 Tax=Biomphalaria pfeifferi TaxID=112525 RepID=A0AAD8B3F2_BIOPF|nr:GTPase IMAP family member [Biomphalaria pfeifferi]